MITQQNVFKMKCEKSEILPEILGFRNLVQDFGWPLGQGSSKISAIKLTKIGSVMQDTVHRRLYARELSSCHGTGFSTLAEEAAEIWGGGGGGEGH